MSSPIVSECPLPLVSECPHTPLCDLPLCDLILLLLYYCSIYVLILVVLQALQANGNDPFDAILALSEDDVILSTLHTSINVCSYYYLYISVLSAGHHLVCLFS